MKRFTLRGHQNQVIAAGANAAARFVLTARVLKLENR
jgi:hypothetical protein